LPLAAALRAIPPKKKRALDEGPSGSPLVVG
jgi:hypothetical protein